MKDIENAFETTAKLILGKKLEGGLDSYAQWLNKTRANESEKVKSAISERMVYVAPMEFFRIMKGNLVTLDESLAFGAMHLSEGEVETLSLANASQALCGIKKTTPEIIYGKNIGTEECACYGPTQSCYRSSFTWFTDRAAYCFMPRTSESVFGCSNVIDCKFSMNCFNSAKLTRCLEVSDSNNCSDCLFCHNCENVDNAMFCFNTKSKRYAIANVEVGREKYMEIKKKVVESIFNELNSTKTLRFGILGLPQ